MSAAKAMSLPLTPDEEWQDYYLRLRGVLLINVSVTTYTYLESLVSRYLGLYITDFIVGTWLVICFYACLILFFSFNEYNIRRRKLTPEIHFYGVGVALYLANLIAITILIHLTGGASSIYPFLYVFLAMVGSFIAPQKLVAPIALIGIFLHGLVLWLEYSGSIVSYPPGVFQLSQGIEPESGRLLVFCLFSVTTFFSLFFGQRLFRVFEQQRGLLVEARTNLQNLVRKKSEDLDKTIEKNKRLVAIEKKLKREMEQLRSRLIWPDTAHPIIGESTSIQTVFSLVEKVGPTSETVLITGETGVGKGLIARLVHSNSDRRDRQMLTVDSPSIPNTLFESELFGHVKGAFSGALHDRKGILQEGDKSTVFLDEIGELPIEIQSKMLLFFEESNVRSVGSNHSRKVDVRIIAATNRDLEAMVKSGEFREDLYHRLSVFRIHVPPLRERIEDIPILAQFLLDQFNEKQQKHVAGFSPEALWELRKRAYPGNVRQLKNIIISAAILVRDDEFIRPEHLSGVSQDPVGAIGLPEIKGLKNILEQYERNILQTYLARFNKDRNKTAEALGVTRQTLWKKMKKFDLLEENDLKSHTL